MNTGEIYQARDNVRLGNAVRDVRPSPGCWISHTSFNFKQNDGKGYWGSKEPQTRPRGLSWRPVDEIRKDEMVQPYSDIWGRDRKTWVPGIRMQTTNPVFQASWHMGMCRMELLGDPVPTKSTLTQVSRSRKKMRMEGPIWWAMRRAFFRIQ